MNKWYFSLSSALLLFSIGGQAQTPPTPGQTSETKIIIIEEKVDRAGNKTVTKTIREGNFTDAEIEKIIQEESQNSDTDHNVNASPESNQEKKGYLGVMIDNAEGGVRITEVIGGSPAEAAGLKAGDILIAVDEQEVANMESLVAAVSSHKPGETVQVRYRRDGASASASATLSEREDPFISDAFEWDEHIKDKNDPGVDADEFKQTKGFEDAQKLHEKMMKEHEEKMKEEHSKEKPRFGVTIDEAEEGPGVVVTSVYEGSLAEEVGIQEGDVITTFNGMEVNSTDELIEAVQAAPADKKVKVVYLRDGKKMKEKVTFERT